jgi:molecular chaperone Hsp33
VSEAPPITDDLVAAFQIEGQPVRGRLVRLGAAVDDVINRHDYPEAVANLLGEACALAALVGASLKFEGRLILQAQGDGPVAYVVADYDTTGALRGYCRYDASRVAEASNGFARPGAKTLLGEGVFIMTIDQGPTSERYQGVTPIEGETLALSAEHYFAGDETRGSTEDAWETAQAYIATLGEDELIDPTITPERLLYRLFHETGVRMFEPKPLRAFCRCSQHRIEGVLKSFPAAERAEMIEPDGVIRVTCEYCSRTYDIEPAAVGADRDD